MPAQILDEPLAISCVFSNGVQITKRLDDLPDAALVRELLVGLARMVHPHGPLNSRNSVMSTMTVIRLLVRGLAKAGHRGGLAELTRGRLTECLWQLGARHDARARALLLSCDGDGGLLAAPVRELAAGRPFRQRPRSQPFAPYSEREWTRLRQVCRGVVDEAFAAHRRALAAAAGGRDPRRHGWSRPNICWLLVREGPQRVKDLAAGRYPVAFRERDYTELRQCRAVLFLGPDVVIAYRLLFGAYSGVVPDGIDGLGVGDLDWAGDATILLDYVKGRTAGESVTLPRPAVRLLERWLEHSALMRRFAPPSLWEDLWLRFTPAASGCWHTGRVATTTLRNWVSHHELLGDDRQPLTIHRHRIRTTFLSLRERGAWYGSRRATVDPNHSPGVEGDHYLTVNTAAQADAVDRIIEGAQADLLRKAQPLRVLDGDQTADLAQRLPDLVADLDLDDTALGELVAGQRDVFVAACADPLAGIHGPAGKPCPARPWVCLLCPLAIFTHRHLANLLRMKAFFARQWQQMPSAHFMAVFGPYAQRVDEVVAVFAGHDPQAVTRAGMLVRDRDDELPLRPEERTA